MGFFAGALVITGVVSRLLLTALRNVRGPQARILFANGASLLIALVLGGIGLADGGGFAAGAALASYLTPQLLWLAYDEIGYYRTLTVAQPLEPVASRKPVVEVEKRRVRVLRFAPGGEGFRRAALAVGGLASGLIGLLGVALLVSGEPVEELVAFLWLTPMAFLVPWALIQLIGWIVAGFLQKGRT